MSALDDARALLAQRSHRKVVIANLVKLLPTVAAAHTNEVAKNVFGSEIDAEVADELRHIEERIVWCIARLEGLNAEDAA